MRYLCQYKHNCLCMMVVNSLDKKMCAYYGTNLLSVKAFECTMVVSLQCNVGKAMRLYFACAMSTKCSKHVRTKKSIRVLNSTLVHCISKCVGHYKRWLVLTIRTFITCYPPIIFLVVIFLLALDTALSIAS